MSSSGRTSLWNKGDIRSIRPRRTKLVGAFLIACSSALKNAEFEQFRVKKYIDAKSPG
jgi:hypothetical protein